MRKSVTRLFAIVLSIILATGACFAGENNTFDNEKKDISSFSFGQEKSLVADAQNTDDKKLERKFLKKDAVNAQSYVEDDGSFIEWTGDYDGVLYKGEKLYLDFYMYDTWVYYYTIPAIDVYREDEYDHEYDELVSCFYPLDPDLIVDVDEWDHFSGYLDIDSSNLEPGNYYMAITAMPCYSNGEWVENLDDFEIPIIWVDFSIKSLSKPSKVTLTSGKKQVKISISKSAGAKKYEIYRSTKKSSGYKKIATISGTTYTNKGLTKGKKYYYKVRAVRGTSESGIAYSSFTTPKLSPKVK